MICIRPDCSNAFGKGKFPVSVIAPAWKNNVFKRHQWLSTVSSEPFEDKGFICWKCEQLFQTWLKENTDTEAEATVGDPDVVMDASQLEQAMHEVSVWYFKLCYSEHITYIVHILAQICHICIAPYGCAKLIGVRDDVVWADFWFQFGQPLKPLAVQMFTTVSVVAFRI